MFYKRVYPTASPICLYLLFVTLCSNVFLYLYFITVYLTLEPIGHCNTFISCYTQRLFEQSIYSTCSHTFLYTMWITGILQHIYPTVSLSFINISIFLLFITLCYSLIHRYSKHIWDNHFITSLPNRFLILLFNVLPNIFIYQQHITHVYSTVLFTCIIQPVLLL